jgi:hypothetical protein
MLMYMRVYQRVENRVRVRVCVCVCTKERETESEYVSVSVLTAKTEMYLGI